MSGAEYDSAYGDGGGHGGAAPIGCMSTADCPSSFTCELNYCVPPEAEVDRNLASSPPVSTPNYVYALNPSSNTVARIDPRDLSIEAVPVGAGPVALFALPNEDAAVALSSGDGSLSVIDSNTLPSKVTRLALGRQHERLFVSADGAFAVACPDPRKPPAAGAEGIVTVIDLAGLRMGKPLEEVRFERAVGFRVTDVIFRLESSRASRAYLFARSTVATIDLTALAVSVLPSRLELPASMASAIDAREVVADPTGQHVVLRSTQTPELAYFDGSTLTAVPLPEIATDLDLLPDGSAAIAALRASKSIAYLRIPEDVLAPAGMQVFSLGAVSVGQVALPPSAPAGGMFALVYTNASDDESFARVELPSGAVRRYPLDKWVDELSISPDSASVIVVHRPNPASTQEDPYERAVDADEGYSVVDLPTGYTQLKRTGKVRPFRYAFSPAGGFLGVALRDELAGRHALDAVNLSSLIASEIRLASAPQFMGAVPIAAGASPHRVFVSQEHLAGRISVIDLDDGQVRTATGFTLNAEIE